MSLTEVIALVNYCRSMLSSTDGKCEVSPYLYTLVYTELMFVLVHMYSEVIWQLMVSIIFH